MKICLNPCEKKINFHFSMQHTEGVCWVDLWRNIFMLQNDKCVAHKFNSLE